MELIQLELHRIVQPIPARPRETHVITFERPSAAGGPEPTVSDAGTRASEAEAEV